MWSEFDLEKKIWTIPASKMKVGHEHRIPLSGPALAILKQMMPLATGKDALVFPSIRSKTMLSDMTLSALVRGMNEVGHDSVSKPSIDTLNPPNFCN